MKLTDLGREGGRKNNFVRTNVDGEFVFFGNCYKLFRNLL